MLTAVVGYISLGGVFQLSNVGHMLIYPDQETQLRQVKQCERQG
jgi:hypothetical protein